MDKQSLLTQITQLASQDLVTRDELLHAFDRGRPHAPVSSLNREVGISEVLYLVGAIIVFIGISVLIWQNWTALSPAGRLLATLGFGVVSYFAGILLDKEEHYGAISFAFHLIAALVLPLGLWVLLDQLGLDTGASGSQSVIFLGLFLTYILSYFFYKKIIFTFFSIAYATLFFFSFTNALIGSNPYFADIKFYEYRFLLVGLSYLSLGYYFSRNDPEQAGLAGPLYTFGNLFFLGAAFALGGWKPDQDGLWEFIFPVLVFASLYVSVFLKSRAYLTVATIYLMAYILKITGEYFTGAIGWPLSLVTCGIALIFIGFYAFRLSKKYLSDTTLPAQNIYEHA